MDNNNIDLLIEIAKIQKKLLLQRIDIVKKTAKSIPSSKKGFFRKANPDFLERIDLLNALKKLKQEAFCIFNEADGYIWWQFKWEELEEMLVNEMIQLRENGKWNFEYEFEKIRNEDSVYLFFNEIGHCSNFETSSASYEYDAINFSESDRSEILRQYNNNIKQKENEFLLRNSNNLIYSELTNKVFSAQEYIESVEHYFWKEHYNSKFESSLQDIHINNTTYAVSRSVHYKAVYLVARYKLGGDRELLGCEFYPYILNYVEGNIPPEFVFDRQKRDPITLVSAFIAESDEVKSVPVRFFRRYMTHYAENLNTALCYAAMITLMADKIYK